VFLPKKIKVAGHTYKVIVDNKSLQKEELAGDAWHGRHLIRISTIDRYGYKRPETFIEDSIIHEILHCVDVQYNNHQIPEDQVRLLATGLHQVLRDMGLIKNEGTETKQKAKKHS